MSDAFTDLSKGRYYAGEPQKHPMRCETCEYPHDNIDLSGTWRRCPIAKCELSYERISLIEVVGCMRHASHHRRSRPAPDALDELERMFPNNNCINFNGDLKGGWCLNPKPLFALKRAIQDDPRYLEEPEAEVIEVVIMELKNQLRRAREATR
jgi:hypothetical protein